MSEAVTVRDFASSRLQRVREQVARPHEPAGFAIAPAI